MWSGSCIQSIMILPDVCDNQLLDFLARFSSVTIHNVGNSVFRSLELLSHLQSETSSTLGGKRSWEHFRWEHFRWEHSRREQSASLGWESQEHWSVVGDAVGRRRLVGSKTTDGHCLRLKTPRWTRRSQAINDIAHLPVHLLVHLPVHLLIHLLVLLPVHLLVLHLIHLLIHQRQATQGAVNRTLLDNVGEL